MVDALIVLVSVLGVWILLGGLLVFFGPYFSVYDWKYPNPRPVEYFVVPFFGFVIVITKIIYGGFELLDWTVHTYYRLTSYTKKYMKRKK